ncbi:MAG: cyclic nucleotide-binding domain-containing protein [Candidatus Puniceispirillaceae bacterium]
MTDSGTKILFHGEALFRAGQKATHFYLVRQGAITIVDQAGGATSREFGADELFGIPEVLARGSWDLSALACGRTEVQIFPAERLFSTLSEMPETHSDFLCRVAAMA